MTAHNYRSIYVYVDCHDEVLHFDSTSSFMLKYTLDVDCHDKVLHFDSTSSFMLKYTLNVDCHDKVLHYDSTYLLFNIRVFRLS